MATKKKRPPKPQDATLRNIRATRRAIARLAERVKRLEDVEAQSRGALTQR